MIRKLVTVGAIITGVVALMAGPAFAHVEIERDGDVSNEGLVVAILKVPNEETDAGTNKIALVFPATPGLTTAQPQLIDGWTFNVEKDAAGNVTQVVWTGGPLTGDAEIELPLTIGTIPDGTATVDFKALQTYDNGTEVRWIEPTPAGGEEPEHPAPVLTVTGDAPEDHDEAATTDTGGGVANADDHTATTTSEEHSDDDGMSTGVIIAIVVGVVIVLALLAWVLSRSRRDMGSKVD
jgi:uncharacterized protein YcnI